MTTSSPPLDDAVKFDEPMKWFVGVVPVAFEKAAFRVSLLFGNTSAGIERSRTDKLHCFFVY